MALRRRRPVDTEPLPTMPPRAAFVPRPDLPLMPVAAAASFAPRRDLPAVALPIGEELTGEARTQLIERMAHAQPDAANPFQTLKARRRRARIILQNPTVEGEATPSNFDWRSHTSAVPKTTALEFVPS